ncbi:OPT/YSL family transporter [Collinsella sp. zg1085]|uniref:OPT/YSL family transporter n=1 Tax=Collinsella sp. zg1085 TaxID=2844380 RepID=UPI001C0D21A8|nr:OPT/YSL family transporter [Collinsella sp. zg1085]QWT17146.1 OPT/YSL family transporter [Collinsella sp. zg1085]
MSSTARSTKRGAYFSVPAILIGTIGCVIITASSVYTALKMGSLPWPTIFTSITSLVVLRVFGRNSIQEANLTQIIMSAGSMVAGGIAFTIPGLWILGLNNAVSLPEIAFVALAGTLLGLVYTALIRKRFVEESKLEYPIGRAAAETLKASEAKGETGKRLLVSMGLAGIWACLRDVVKLIPAMWGSLPIEGVAFGFYNSPMLVSVGFLIGAESVVFQLLGVVIAHGGIIVGGTQLGFLSVPAATGFVASLGMGIMMGSGIGVVLKDIAPKFFKHLCTQRDEVDTSNMGALSSEKDAATGSGKDCELQHQPRHKQGVSSFSRFEQGGLALMVASATLILVSALHVPPVATVLVVGLSFVTTIMSAQSVGKTGIDPMEIFGLIVLLLVAATGVSSPVTLFFVAAVVAVTCGLAGDVMSDFKTGAILGNNPKALWYAQALGALLGCVVAVLILGVLVAAYGPESFGPGKFFVAAQASVVATMVSGIPSMFGFVLGLVTGIVLYVVGLPAMMFGLGVYLPAYMTISMSVGALIKYIYERISRARGIDQRLRDERGIIVASGVLGGESIVGVLIALVSVCMGLFGASMS